MKKLLISIGVICLPIVASAAYNDVSITSSAIITAGGINLTVSGDSGVVASIVVDTDNFVVTLSPSSTLTVVSADKRTFGVSIPGGVQALTDCTSSQSSLTLTSPADSASTDTITVTPGAGTCVIPTTGGGASGGGSSGGGGGGGSAPVIVVATTTSQTTTTTSTDAAIVAQQAQVLSLLATLRSLQGQLGVSVSSGAGAGFTFTKNLTLGSRNSDVINVQKVLNSDSDTQVAVSGPGSKGNETTYFGPATKKAIQKFQVKHGLAKVGGVGYGVFGPKTKAKLGEISRLRGL